MHNSPPSPDDIKFVIAFPAENLCAPAFWNRMNLTKETMLTQIPRRAAPDVLAEMDCQTKQMLTACAKVLTNNE